MIFPCLIVTLKTAKIYVESGETIQSETTKCAYDIVYEQLLALRSLAKIITRGASALASADVPFLADRTG